MLLPRVTRCRVQGNGILEMSTAIVFFDILDVSVQEKYCAEMYAGFHSVQGIAIIFLFSLFFFFFFLLTNCCDYRREKWCRNICYW